MLTSDKLTQGVLSFMESNSDVANFLLNAQTEHTTHLVIRSSPTEMQFN